MILWALIIPWSDEYAAIDVSVAIVSKSYLSLFSHRTILRWTLSGHSVSYWTKNKPWDIVIWLLLTGIHVTMAYQHTTITSAIYIHTLKAMLTKRVGGGMCNADSWSHSTGRPFLATPTSTCFRWCNSCMNTIMPKFKFPILITNVILLYLLLCGWVASLGRLPLDFWFPWALSYPPRR